MNTRREVLLGGLLTMLFLDGHGCSRVAPPLQARSGCMVCDAEAVQILAKSSQTKNAITGAEPIISSSGDREFDYALAQTLSRMADTLDVLPGFAFYDDTESGNAYATSMRRLASSDGTVLFGTKLLRKLLSETRNPDVAVTAVCAHEFAHILQYKKKLIPVLKAGQTTVRRIELHADFLSGFYAGKRKLQKRDYPATVFVDRGRKVGDHEVDNPQHHGRPAERAAAVVRGFEVAYRDRRSLGDAVQIGINFVTSLPPSR